MSKQRVLILYTGDSARSQMAEGLLRHRDGDHFEVLSAGTKPSVVNPSAVKAMSEVGMDMKAVAQLSASATLTKVEDIREIMAFRILAAPALVINGEVKSAGRIPNATEITTWLATAANKQ